MAEAQGPAPRDAGHLMAQVAACRGGVGLARCTRLDVIELHGAGADLASIARQLVGRGVPAGRSARMRGGWWQTQAPQRALVVADAPRSASFDRLVRPVLGSRPDVAAVDVSPAHVGLILAGPSADRLAASAAVRLAAPTMVGADGDVRLLVLPASRGADAWHVLLDAGRRHGAVAVDAHAVELYRAAQRPRSGRHPLSSSPAIAPITTGVLTS